MRASLTFATVVAVGFAVVPLGSSKAADTPKASQIIESLSPSDNAGIATRGIRLGGQPPAVAPASGATGASAVVPAATQPVVHGEANLTVPFRSGSASITPAAAQVLDQLGEALTSAKLADFRFRVEGHTDTVGAPDRNKALSQQRAASVADYLATKFNIDRARLTPVGMGEDGLLIATGPGVANSSNRRVLVVNLGR